MKESVDDEQLLEQVHSWRFLDARPQGWCVVPPDRIVTGGGMQMNCTLVRAGSEHSYFAMDDVVYDDMVNFLQGVTDWETL